jgi:flagellar hook-length control protein FliK
VEFRADAHATRQAIEGAFAQLAAALHGAGVTLSGGGVFQQSSGREGARGDSAPAKVAGSGRAGSAATLAAAPIPAPARRGLVDFYA